MSNFQKLVTNRWFVIFGTLFIMFLIVVQFRQYKVRKSVQKEIGNLSSQADQLQKNNQDLENMIAYLKTDSYKEKAAREQLSMKKPGEVVYSFSEAKSVENGSTTSNSSSANTVTNQSNPSKWWNYFFKSN